MKGVGNNRKTVTIGRLLSVGLMIVCLTLLTSMNFFLYSSAVEQVSSVVTTEAGSGTDDSANNYPPSGPTEEKSGNQGFSFSEEILHEAHPEFSFSASNHFYLHHIAEAEKIEMFHPELLLPPPKM